MAIARERLEQQLFGAGRRRRWTQDSPVLPDVWLAFGEDPTAEVEVLLTPHRSTRAGRLAKILRARLERYRTLHPDAWPAGGTRPAVSVAATQTTVAARLSLDELIRVALPMTPWWSRYVVPIGGAALAALLDATEERRFAAALEHPDDPAALADGTAIRPELVWMVGVIGALAAEAVRGRRKTSSRALLRGAVELLSGRLELGPDEHGLLWLVNRNRAADLAVYRSTLAVKADAARRLFEVRCDELVWAVVDSGIDAEHPAFRRRRPDGEPTGSTRTGRRPFYAVPFETVDGRPKDRTRIEASYDLSAVRTLLDPDALAPERRGGLPRALQERLAGDGPDAERVAAQVDELRAHLASGRELDWTLVEPLIRIPHEHGLYRSPRHDHGTHVAGILAADWERDLEDEPPQLEGMCPDLRVLDLRVLDDQGHGDELAVIAALQFVRHLNTAHDYVVVHGVNLSLSIRHDVANFACGRTPVCDECERLVGAGVVVVAAAGNEGYAAGGSEVGPAEGYRGISITDPGNADAVITVGATHRSRPHTYGISYFSSRGPTGDGRAKPDLVAPGEKVTAPVPGEDLRRKDGTSMAAPHVSGAAAMLMARHAELIGQPTRIKHILCSTATDLGRERYFQGAGMLDVLRALQSV